MVKVTGISQVIWKYSKSNFKYESYDELLNDLLLMIREYLDDNITLTEREIVDIVVRTYCDYAENGIKHHLSYEMFKQIIGDPVLQMVYGSDLRSTNQKIVEGILIALRNTQVYNDNEILIDFGQQ